MEGIRFIFIIQNLSNYKMGCLNDKDVRISKIKKTQSQTKISCSKNPMTKIAKQWSIQTIKQIWLDNQLDILKHKLGQNVQFITLHELIQLLPSLKSFSQQSQNNIFDLFNFQQQKQLGISNFLIVQIIVLKSDENDLLSDIFFYVYSSLENKSALNQKDFRLFQKEMKQCQLQSLHAKKSPQKNQNNQITVSKRQFRQFFQQYNINSIKSLFKFNLKDQQTNFQRYLSTKGINRNTSQTVYLIQWQWFLKWKIHIQIKYQIKVQIRANNITVNNERSKIIYTSTKDNDNIIDVGQKQASVEVNSSLGPLNNLLIKGEQDNELRENLIEFQDFVSVSQDVWSHIRLLYGGGPQIKKTYPNFYNKKIVLTILQQQQCKFQPGFAKALSYNPQQTFQFLFKKRKQNYFLKYSSQDMVLYYKFPGKLEWTKIQNLKNKIQQQSFRLKTFLVFVRKNVAHKFEENFNVSQSNGNKIIKERIKNFGNSLSCEYEGTLQQGHVGNIFKNSVMMYIKNQRGHYIKIQKTYNQLQRHNSKILEDQVLTGLAGLQNTGNSCYMNASLQCVLRAPCFEEYLVSLNLTYQNENMITYQLQSIYEQSKQSRDCVGMTVFKKKFDYHFPFFEGSAQHDAQQFLILLLDKLSQQKPSGNQSKFSQSGQKQNKKIFNFFSGKTQTQTQCLKCHNKGHSQQTFFTYSLSLPFIKQVLFHFFYIDQSFKVWKYSLTIQKYMQIGQVRDKMSIQIGISQSNLLIMSVFQHQWMNDVSLLQQTYHISSIQNYDAKIVCYKIRYSATPDYDNFKQSQTLHKSVKLQVRNRKYDTKTQKYISFYFPFYLQVDKHMTGGQLKQQLSQKLQNFINQQQYQMYKKEQIDSKQDEDQRKEMQQKEQNIFLSGATNRDKEKLFQAQSKDTKWRLSKGGKSQEVVNNQNFRCSFKEVYCPFVIQYLKNQDNNQSLCWFCKKTIREEKKQSDQKSVCVGCEFHNDQLLYQNKLFMKKWQNLVITVNWKSQTLTKNCKVSQTASCKQAQKLQKLRRGHIEKLLEQSTDQQQIIQLRCSMQACRFPQALRKQRIKQYPSILILHLKRFSFSDNQFHKLKNKVQIPQLFTFPNSGQKYELYGNVVHYGSANGRGGHYINYVKVSSNWYRCDDEKVVLIQREKQYLNPDSYLLFYRKKDLGGGFSLFGL